MFQIKVLIAYCTCFALFFAASITQIYLFLISDVNLMIDTVANEVYYVLLFFD